MATWAQNEALLGKAYTLTKDEMEAWALAERDAEIARLEDVLAQLRGETHAGIATRRASARSGPPSTLRMTQDEADARTAALPRTHL